MAPGRQDQAHLSVGRKPTAVTCAAAHAEQQPTMAAKQRREIV
jgi:hypothetical protein